jgi:hypothetical protein
MTSDAILSLAQLNDSERSRFFWACMGYALLLQIALAVAAFVTSIVIQFIVTFVGLFFVESAAQLDPLIRVLQWVSLVPWTLATFWWYTRWLFRHRFGSASVVFSQQRVV